jgi:hypothetical protein
VGFAKIRFLLYVDITSTSTSTITTSPSTVVLYK